MRWFEADADEGDGLEMLGDVAVAKKEAVDVGVEEEEEEVGRAVVRDVEPTGDVKVGEVAGDVEAVGNVALETMYAVVEPVRDVAAPRKWEKR